MMRQLYVIELFAWQVPQRDLYARMWIAVGVGAFLGIRGL